MESKSEIMVALGTAIGANCIPCFDHLYARSREAKLTDAEIRDIVEIATKVKNGAALFLKQNIAETLGDEPNPEQPCCVRNDQTEKATCC